MNFEKQTGTVIWFKSKQGYGFIKPDSQIDNEDIFVHWSAVQMEGYKQLKTGQKVEYVLKDTPKGVVAVEVKAIA